MAQPFHAKTLQVSGRRRPASENWDSTPLPSSHSFPHPMHGVDRLSTRATARSELVWFDRQGGRLGAAMPARRLQHLVPDSRTITHIVLRLGGSGIRKHRLMGAGEGRRPVLRDRPSPDQKSTSVQSAGPSTPGSRLRVPSRRASLALTRPLNHRARREKSMVRWQQNPKIASDWSRDGRFIVILN